jgi:nicotinamidase-related amidase
MLRREFLAALASLSQAQTPTLRVTARSIRKDRTIEEPQVWKVSESAIIICDMWNGHYCQSSVRRINEMVPRMNATIGAARSLGVQIVHAPSGTLDVYAGTPQRKRMLAAKPATPPFPLAKWCYLDRTAEAPLPFNDSVSPCDDEVVGPAVKRFDRQHPGLTITEPDGISDSGDEIYSFFRQQGIRNVAMMGVHTNMCVLGRPFGIRQLTRLGFNVVLARDLTDSMYDPREAPWVSHARGNELMMAHVEQYWCPTIAGADLTRVQGKS